MLVVCIRKRDGARMLLLAEYRLEERTFACTVRPDDRRQLSAMNMQIHIVQDDLIGRFYRKIIDLDTTEATTAC